MHRNNSNTTSLLMAAITTGAALQCLPPPTLSETPLVDAVDAAHTSDATANKCNVESVVKLDDCYHASCHEQELP